MLVLKRRLRDTIIITGRAGEKTVLHIWEIGPDQVRIGIEAVADVKVLRGELIDDGRGYIPRKQRITDDNKATSSD